MSESIRQSCSRGDEQTRTLSGTVDLRVGLEWSGFICGSLVVTMPPERMPNRYLQEGELRAAGVRDLFAAVARRYDLINDLQSFGLHRLWKRKLIRLANIQRGELALDLCCGTGDISFGLAARGAEVVGVDFSEPMLSMARRRAHRIEGQGDGTGCGRERTDGGKSRTPRFEQGDAMRLRFPDASFDVVAISYGLRNLTNIDGALAEMARVTKPGGRLLVLDFGRPANRVWRRFYFLHLQYLVPVFGRVFCGDAETHSYILESLKRYPDAPEIGRRMEATGWSDIEWWNLLGGVMDLHRGHRDATRIG